MLRKVKLYGELAQFVGHKEFEIKAETLSKAVSFLINNFDGIEKFMSPKYYQVKVGDYAIGEDEVNNPIGQQDIHFVPVISGAGRGVGKVLLGAALIGLAIANPAVGFGLGPGGLGGGFATAAGTFSMTAFAGNLGIGLVLMGVSEMLTPLPKQKDFSSEEDPRLSYNFSGTQNTSRAGTPVPICYGEIITGSVVISGAVDTQQVQA
jgi:predicted phage tail protein|tara:strand:+ start:36 stop:656 length:621 start_codon:yes stop_codon:yes gene_type:complete